MLRGTVFVATSVYSMARQKHRTAEKEGTLEVSILYNIILNS